MKKTNLTLSAEHKTLVESHLSTVHWVIMENIHVNERIYGLGYDDLFQEGCIWLCHAAVTYEPGRASFRTYAKKVVRNGLLSYCRSLCSREKQSCHLLTNERGELEAGGRALEQADSFTTEISLLETVDLLESRKGAYRGVARLGIEALELKIRGFNVTEIALLYHVPAPHVGAWISRTSHKLRNDPKFIADIT